MSFKSEWGPWITKGLPDVGLYVQVEVKHDLSGERSRKEGIVAGWDGTLMWFVGEDKGSGSDLNAERWREHRGPEIEKTMVNEPALDEMIRHLTTVIEKTMEDVQ